MFPRIIFQTWKTHDLLPRCEPWFESWDLYNPTYEHKLYSDKDNEKFISDNFPHYLKYYNNFHAGIYKSDFVRYLYLYLYGGIYADIDFECLKSFDDLLLSLEQYDIVLGKLREGGFYKIPNAIMISQPGCSFWIKLIEYIIYQTGYDPNKVGYKRNMAPDYITGPFALEKVYDNYSEKQKICILDSHYFYHRGCFKTDIFGRNNKFFMKFKKAEAIYAGSYAFTYWMYSWQNKWQRKIKGKTE